MAVQYKSIGMREQDYQVLREKKEAIERLIKKRLDWADFLLLLADLKPVGEVVGQKIEVAELNDSTGETTSGPDGEWEEFSGLPITLADADQERIADLIAAKVSERLKGG
jgi:hypothetical protein